MLSTRNCFGYAYSAGTFADFVWTFSLSASENSTNILDLIGAATPTTVRLNEGKAKMTLHIMVIALFTGAASGLKLLLMNHTGEAIASGKTIWDSGILNVSQLAAGAQINVTLPAGIYSRYLGLRYEKISQDVTAGSIVAWIDEGVEPNVTQLDLDDVV